jgi:hypothetical protein
MFVIVYNATFFSYIYPYEHASLDLPEITSMTSWITLSEGDEKVFIDQGRHLNIEDVVLDMNVR